LREKNDMKNNRPLALAIVGCGIALRCAGLFRPLLGNFGAYQSAQAMMADFFLRDHFSTWLLPKVNMLVQGEPGKVLLYYPVSSLISAAMGALTGGHLAFWGRLQAVVFFGLAAWWLYRLMRHLFEERTALAALAAFSMSPLTIVYGQSFQNDMAAAFFALLFVEQVRRHYTRRFIYHFWTAVCALSMVLLMRPNALYLAALPIWLAFSQEGTPDRKWNNGGRGLLIVCLGLILPALWFYHCWLVTYSDPSVYSSLYSQLGSRDSFASPLILRLEYYKALYDALAGMVMTPVGLTFWIAGIFFACKLRGAYGFLVFWCAVFFLSHLAIPRKLIDHDFYFLPLVLPASGLVALAWTRTTDALKHAGLLGRRGLGIFLAVAAAVSLRYAVHPAFVTPAREVNYVLLAEKVKQYARGPHSRVIFQGPYSLLYCAGRLGWSVEWDDPDLPEKIRRWVEKEGATHFALSSPRELADHPELENYLGPPHKRRYKNDAIGALYEFKRQNV